MTPPSAAKSTFRTTLTVAAAALIVLLAAAPVIFVKFFLTPEWIQENVVPEIEAALGRDVEFHDIRLSFRGLSLQNLEVSEAPGFAREELPGFASLDSLVLGVELLPLLRREIVIDEIIIGDPVIVVHRNADGEFNFSSLAGDGDTVAVEATEDPATQAGQVAEEAEADEQPLSLVAEKIRVQNARVLFIDETAEGGLGRLELRRLNVVADAVSADEPFEFVTQFAIVLSEATPIELSVSGRVDASVPSAQLSVNTDLLDVDSILASLATGDDEEREAQQGSPPTDLAGYAGSIRMKIDTLKAGGLTIQDVHAIAELSENIVALSELSAKLAGGRIEGDGSVELGGAAAAYSIRAGIERLQLNQLAAAAGDLAVDVASGELSLQATARGTGSPDLDAWAEGELATGEKVLVESVRLTEVGMHYPSAASGQPRSVTVSDLDLTIPALYVDRPSDFTVAAALSTSDAEPTPVKVSGSLDLAKAKLDLTVTAGAVDLDAFLATDTADVGQDEPVATDAEPVDTGPLTVSLVFDAESLSASGLTLGTVHTRTEIDNGNVSLRECTATVAGGKIEASGSIDLRNADRPLRGELEITDAALDALVAPFWKDEFGQATGTLAVWAKLWGEAGDTETMQGGGRVSLDDGSFSDSDLMATLARVSGVPELADLALQDSGGEFEIADGVVSTERFLLGDATRRVVLVGEVVMEDCSLDMEASVGVSPEAETQPSFGGASDYLKDADGWTAIPLAVAGSCAAPSAGIPKRALAEKAKQLVPQALEKALGENAGQVLKGLGGLFGGGDDD